MSIPAMAALFLSVAAAFVVLGRRQKTRWPYFLAAGSIAGFVAGVVLHNVIGAFFKVEDAFFFILALFVCPALFLIGLGGILYNRSRKK